ncbi:MAG: DUF1643 domain-containing protein [Gemmobacter sp.]|jgi:hypothetical protein
MIERTHRKGDADSRALYSPCMAYRFALERIWSGGPRLLFVALNPSTATEVENDPTVERCERRARAMGYGGFGVANIFALRATDPRAMRAHPEPVGAGNDAAILRAAGGADRIIACWGAHGAHLGRGAAVAAMLRGAGHALWHLGLTQAGDPRHPLYLPYARAPEPWAAG